MRRGVSPWAKTAALGGACLAATVLLFAVAPDYRVFELTQVAISALAVMGLSLLIGVSGQISLGHGAFFALGAVTAALTTLHTDIPAPLTPILTPILATLLAGLVCFLAGGLFGAPALRLEGVYLALATFALAIAAPQILKLSPLAPWTGGSQGLSLPAAAPPDALARGAAALGLRVGPDQWLFLITLVAGLGLYATTRNLVRRRTGRAWRALRDHPIAAAAMGAPPARLKILAFALSAMIVGVAGALSALQVRYVGPDSFPLALSISLLVGVVLGGVGWLPGALVGGAFLVYAPILADAAAGALGAASSVGYADLLYGALLLAVVFAAPKGAAGAARAVARWAARAVARWRARRPRG